MKFFCLPSIARRAAQSVFAALALIAASGAFAQKIPVEGTDYRLVQPAQPVDVPNKIEVIEFFWYGCPHCNLMEPVLADWIKQQGPDVIVRRIPVAFTPAWVPHQRLYYTLDALGKETELRAKVFAAIHLEKNPLNTVDSMADWAAKNGIDRKKFLDTYNSFSINAKTQRAGQIAQAFGVDGVPTIGVDGRYALNVTPLTVGNIDYFVAKERALMKPMAASAPSAAPASAAPATTGSPAKKSDKKG